MNKTNKQIVDKESFPLVHSYYDYVIDITLYFKLAITV